MNSSGAELLAVTVDVWHPDCWVLQTTRETDVHVIGHQTNDRGDTATGWYTLAGPSTTAIDGALAAIDDSSLTDAVDPLDSPGTAPAETAGRVTRDVIVEFDAGPSIRGAFTAHGFTHRGRTWYEDGRERRPFVVRGDRDEAARAIDAVASEYDADVDVRALGPARTREETTVGTRLSAKQREAFELARRRGYYEYPRETTATALAEEFGVTKTTFLEHLRKAESKLLADVPLQ